MTFSVLGWSQLSFSCLHRKGGDRKGKFHVAIMSLMDNAEMSQETWPANIRGKPNS